MTISIKGSNLPLPSAKLQMMLVEANLAFGHSRETILAAFSQAKSEGFTAIEAAKLIRSNITWLSDRTLRLYLPDEAKDKKMQSLARRRPRQNCSEVVEKLNSQDQNIPESFLQETRINIDPSPELYEVPETLSDEIRINVDSDPEPYEMAAKTWKETKLSPSITISDTAKIILNNELAKIIHYKVGLNKEAGIASEFELLHDGKNVLSVTML